MGVTFPSTLWSLRDVIARRAADSIAFISGARIAGFSLRASSKESSLCRGIYEFPIGVLEQHDFVVCEVAKLC